MTNRQHNDPNGVDLPSIFDICTPRDDIKRGIVESELAANLSHVVSGKAHAEYADPVKFFASTYPTKGIETMLTHVSKRLSGNGHSSVFLLDTSFGGGKTHTLIALLHAAQAKHSDSEFLNGFIDESLLPTEHVRVAVFDGQDADISNGHNIGSGITARTPWGEIAYWLAGRDGYNKVDDRIEASAPGADTMVDLIGNSPVLILLDELAIYLRRALMHDGAQKQLTAFLSSLIVAVERSPKAALVYTLSTDKNSGAYSEENTKIMKELKAVSARQVTLKNPTEEGETIQILCRRLFKKRDRAKAEEVIEAYRQTWKKNRSKLSEKAGLSKTIEEFRNGYPLHPELLEVLVSKTSTMEDFQRVRGMLRLLGHVVYNLWTERDSLRPTAIHVHHIDLGYEAIRLEVTSKLKQEPFAPAIDTDIACDDTNKKSLAQRIDRKYYSNMPPFTTYVARTIFMNTLAFNQSAKGIPDKDLRYSIASPGLELRYIDEALERFKDESLYLDDNAQKPTQFQAEPNLNQSIQRAEHALDDSDCENEIDNRLRATFGSGQFDTCMFPDGHESISDDTEKPKLIILKYTGTTISNPEKLPSYVTDMLKHKGIGGLRINRNNVLFLAPSDGGVDTMYEMAKRYLALKHLATQDSLTNFADYQKNDIKEKLATVNSDLKYAILDCYKFIYYPAKGDKLTYTKLDWENAKYEGQKYLLEELRTKKKIRTSDDHLDNPKLLIKQISSLSGGQMTTRAFRDEFYRNTELPMLIGNEAFKKCILHGVENGIFIYQRADMWCGSNEPYFDVTINDAAIVYTLEHAKKTGVWPRKKESLKPGHKWKQKSKPKPKFGKSTFSTEGTPTNAIRNILHELRKNMITSITGVQIKSHNDVFPLISMMGRMKDKEIHMEMTSDYETTSGSTFRCEFDGRINDGQPVIEFIKPQLKNPTACNLEVTLTIKIEPAISIEWFDTLADRLRLIENDITLNVDGLRQNSGGST